MRKDRFTDGALKAAYALAELKYSENPEDQLAFAEAYDRLKTEMRSGQGAKREAELAKMTPEELRRARTEEAIKRRIKNKVVRAR